MAKPTDSGNGNIGNVPTGGAPPSVQVRVVGQYIKDLSFENPNVRKMIEGPGEKPALRVEVNVNAAKVADKVFESTILFKAEAGSDTGVIYDLELAYAGLFEIQNLPEQALEPFLLITPGFLTDVMALALLIPPIRRKVARWCVRRLVERAHVQIKVYEARSRGESGPPGGDRVAGPVIEGDFERLGEKARGPHRGKDRDQI